MVPWKKTKKVGKYHKKKRYIHKCPWEGEQNRKGDVKFADRVRNTHTGEDRQERNLTREREREREREKGTFKWAI